MREEIKFIFYGKFKHNKKYSKFLPKGSFKKINLKGFEMYDLGSSIGVIKKENKHIIGELWTFKLNKYQKIKLFLMLSLIELTFINLYKKELIETPYGSCYIYLYNQNIKNKKSIIEFK